EVMESAQQAGSARKEGPPLAVVSLPMAAAGRFAGRSRVHLRSASSHQSRNARSSCLADREASRIVRSTRQPISGHGFPYLPHSTKDLSHRPPAPGGIIRDERHARQDRNAPASGRADPYAAPLKPNDDDGSIEASAPGSSPAAPRR